MWKKIHLCPSCDQKNINLVFRMFKRNDFEIIFKNLVKIFWLICSNFAWWIFPIFFLSPSILSTEMLWKPLKLRTLFAIQLTAGKYWEILMYRKINMLMLTLTKQLLKDLLRLKCLMVKKTSNPFQETFVLSLPITS